MLQLTVKKGRRKYKARITSIKKTDRISFRGMQQALKKAVFGSKHPRRG